jgi:flap endonuclease-1
MGVKLQNIIVRKKIEYQNLVGKIIAVDAPNIIMNLFNFTLRSPKASNINLILDRTQRPISHLYGLLYRINFYFSKKILPIFSFDGKVSELKRLITKDQLKDFIFSERWYQEAIRIGNRNLARKIALSKEYMWQNIIKESKQLLGALGIPYIDSPASAESQCAYLVKEGYANFTNSQDFDALLFGSLYVLQNLSKSLRRKIQGKWQFYRLQPMSIDLNKNLTNLRISIFQLVDIGILAGNDYFPGISKIGPRKALQLIRKYHTLESIILKENNNFDFHNLTPEIINKVRKLFLFPEVNEKIENLLWNLPNKTRVVSLLCQEHKLNIDRVENNLKKFEKNYRMCKDHFLLKNKKKFRKQITLDFLF